MDAALLDRIGEALAAGRDTPTPTLTALLLEAGGEQCWQRGRLLHRLSNIFHAIRPIMSQSTTHRFKADFARLIASNPASAPVIEVNGTTKSVTPESLTDADVPLLQQYGYGHLIEALPKKVAEPKALAEITSIADQTIADVDAATPKKKKH